MSLELLPADHPRYEIECNDKGWEYIAQLETETAALKVRLSKLNTRLDMLDDVLETLSKLGNGNSLGTSTGNQIAHDARKICRGEV